MLGNSQTVSSLCVHNYVIPVVLHFSSYQVNVLRVLNRAVASTGKLIIYHYRGNHTLIDC